MIQKVNLSSHSAHEVFGSPGPLGLFGLAVACAALTPVAFGHGITPDGKIIHSAFNTAAIFALLFGGVCQLIAGLMDFANKNTYGGTIFTAFAFNWIITALVFFSVGLQFPLDHTVILATEILLFVTFIFLTYGFGFFSKMLFLLLLDIDILYVCKIGKALTHNTAFFQPLIGICTVILGLLGLWISLAGLINPVSGRNIFKISGPLFFAPAKKSFDFSLRKEIFEILYFFWKENAFQEISMKNMQETISVKFPEIKINPEIYYLMESGYVHLTEENSNIVSLRLTSPGIDLYEQLILKKYDI